jgi:hypothetical protein
MADARSAAEGVSAAAPSVAWPFFWAAVVEPDWAADWAAGWVLERPPACEVCGGCGVGVDGFAPEGSELAVGAALRSARVKLSSKATPFATVDWAVVGVGVAWARLARAVRPFELACERRGLGRGAAVAARGVVAACAAGRLAAAWAVWAGCEAAAWSR